MLAPRSTPGIREWAEEKLDADEYEAIFGEVAEDDSRTQMCICVSTRVANIIRQEAAKAGITISAYIESLV